MNEYEFSDRYFPWPRIAYPTGPSLDGALVAGRQLARLKGMATYIQERRQEHQDLGPLENIPLDRLLELILLADSAEAQHWGPGVAVKDGE